MGARGYGQQLNPSFHLLDLVEPYEKKAARQRYAPGRILRRVSRAMREWERLLRSLPADLDEMVQGMRAGTFSVHLDHRRLDPVVNRLVLGLLTSSLLLGSSLLWSLHAEPLVKGVSLFGAIGYALERVVPSTPARPRSRWALTSRARQDVAPLQQALTFPGCLTRLHCLRAFGVAQQSPGGRSEGHRPRAPPKDD